MILALVLTATAPAAACPDLSGTYESTAGGERQTIELRQTGCSRIEMTQPGGERETWIVDGVCRPVPGQREICVTHAFEKGALVNRGRLQAAGLPSPVRRFEQVLRREADGSLVSEAKIFDLLGGLEDHQRMRYTPLKEGQGPSRTDAR